MSRCPGNSWMRRVSPLHLRGSDPLRDAACEDGHRHPGRPPTQPRAGIDPVNAASYCAIRGPRNRHCRRCWYRSAIIPVTASFGRCCDKLIDLVGAKISALLADFRLFAGRDRSLHTSNPLIWHPLCGHDHIAVSATWSKCRKLHRYSADGVDFSRNRTGRASCLCASVAQPRC
jgi:hypothetical protein